MTRLHRTLLLHLSACLLVGAAGAQAQTPSDRVDSPPSLARARELGGALIVERARIHREGETALRPTLEGLDQLRAALRAYRDAQQAIGTLTAARAAAPVADAGSDALAQRRGAARDAVDVIRVRRQALAATAAPEPAVGSGGNQQTLRLEVLEAIEDEAEVLLATNATEDTELVGKLDRLLDRLERPAPTRVPARFGPAIILHDDTGRPGAAQ